MNKEVEYLYGGFELMKFEQKQIAGECPVCKHTNQLYLDWVVTIESEGGFVPLFRCSGCYSPFYIKKNDGTIETYLGNATD